MEIGVYTMYLLDPEISDFILLSGLFCVKVVTELHQDFHCLWRGGRRKKKTQNPTKLLYVISYVSPYLISQDKTFCSLVVFCAKKVCLDTLFIRCYFMNKVQCEKKLLSWRWLHFWYSCLKGLQWSRKFEPSPYVPPSFYSGHFSDIPEKVSCYKITFKKLIWFLTN